ncbi:hypothetical protein [Rhizobium sp. Leaf262]|uniref:hypothetical protein n=1 Tax=Rhizobium sp. Leaf262 TaxID=1736312 RepID=UPI0012E7D38F|nr:hypothetical protein [Rhizobium sp. Leaf262]
MFKVILQSKRKGLDFRRKRASLRPHAGWLTADFRFAMVWISPEAGFLRTLKGWAFPACESVNFLRRQLDAAFAHPGTKREALSFRGQGA